MARKLMEGHEGGTVRMPSDPGCTECTRVDEAVQQQLAAIGIDVELVDSNDPFGDMMDHPGQFEMRIGGSGPDFPDLASYLVTVFTQYLPETWLPGSVRDALGAIQADTDEGSREQRARDLLAGPVYEDVPVTGFGYNVGGFLFSPRIGCPVFPPFGDGVALDALCLAKGAGTASPTAQE
jgi:hypothetical protein